MTGRRPPEHELIATRQPRPAWISNHTQHHERLAAYWEEALGGPTHYAEQYGPNSTATKRPLFASIAATGRTTIWTAGPSLVSIRHSLTSVSPTTSGSD